jgi:6-methylsalicylic acid synthase
MTTLNDAGREPIAIVGMGCRFPGGIDSPAKYWEMLVSGREAIGTIPDGRWDDYAAAGGEHAAAVRRAVRYGGFLDDIDGFDAAFFGISPREAALIDPQQRIALEVTWEALEHAGVSADRLAGTESGVFIGVNTDDYGRRLLEDLPRIEAWTGIGSSLCGVANRVSYTLDLRGPSLAVDTACSASLAAVEMACEALRQGTVPLAIAGGVMLIAAPALTLVMDAAGALSPDGRCKPFDAAADGYGRGEGCGILVLKRLSDARRDGGRIFAVIRGGSVNQDGRTNGIMAPSREAQEYLFRLACHRAGVSPDSVDYVEAHGTGTKVGDPIEAAALAAVFGSGHTPRRPCLIGSVKSNIGHLEAASGVAGVMKAALALHHRVIPPSLNLTKPNPEIDWAESGLRVVTETIRWTTPDDRPRRAGVSAYGYGGTIAHLVLEEADAGDRSAAAAAVPRVTLDDVPRLYPLSGESAASVREYAGRLADWLHRDGAHASLKDVGHTLAHGRAHLTHRYGIVAADRDELTTRLRAVAEGRPVDGVSAGTPRKAAADPGLVWVFSGHGSQWTGMGRELLDREPVFREVLENVEPIFQAEIGFSPIEEIVGGELRATDRIQPMIFALQAGLAEVWGHYGVRPAAVLGHSVGEIAAAVAAGVLDLQDGARLVCRRSLLLRQAMGNGSMAMVNLSFEEVSERLVGRPDVVAAISASPTSTVVAGDSRAVEAIAEEWRRAEGRFVRRVDSDVAFHSAHMDPLLPGLVAAADDLTPWPARIPTYTTALADPRGTATRDGHYWAANLRNPVRFAQAIEAALEDGHRAFLEISAHPVVVPSMAETFGAARAEDAVATYTLRRHRPERATLLANLGTLHGHGVPVDWAAAQPPGHIVDLPRSVWQRRPYVAETRRRSRAHGRAHDPDEHTLLGSSLTVNTSPPTRLWQTDLDESNRPYPGDHPVQGTEIVPAAVLLNTFFAAAGDGGPPPALADVGLRVPVAVSDTRTLQVILTDGVLRLSSRALDDESDSGWLTHTTAVVSTPAEEVCADEPFVDAARARCTEPLSTDQVIGRLADVGVAAMGFPWRILELSRGEGAMVARVSTHGPDDEEPATWAPLLDAAMSMAAIIFSFSGPAVLRMPAHIRRVALLGRPPTEALVGVRTHEGAGGRETVDVDITTTSGELVARFLGLRYGEPDGDIGAPASPRRLVHEIVWQPLDPDTDAFVAHGQGGNGTALAAPSVAVFVGDDGRTARAFGPALAEAGIRTLSVPRAADLPPSTEPAAVILVPAGGRDTFNAAVDTAWQLIDAAQRLAGRGDRAHARLWCLTNGVREGGSVDQSPVWGVGRVLASEHPELWGGVIDLDPRNPSAGGSSLARLLRTPPGEEIIALRDGAALAARLVPLQRDEAHGSVGCRADGTYLITGGLGTLGLEVAHWLAGRGARRLVLVGRNGLPPHEDWAKVLDPATRDRIESVRALESGGVTVRTLALDVADREAAAKLLDAQALGLPPIRGIVHAAGTLDNRLAMDVDRQSLHMVMRPKVGGALVLHELFPPGSLDFLVLFSSAGPLLGLPGQAAYAAANTFLDALAAHRRAADRRHTTTAISWTSWRGLGMSTSSAVIDAELAARGTADIAAADAFRAWEYIERHDVTHVAVLRTIPLEPGMQRPALLRGLPTDVAAPPDGADAADLPWAGLTGDELRNHLVEEVRRQVAAELRLPAEELDPRRPLAELGLDSVLSLVVRQRLERHLRLRLPGTLLWNAQSAQSIGDSLAEVLSARADDVDAR